MLNTNKSIQELEPAPLVKILVKIFPVRSEIKIGEREPTL
jgi:hypothetical protein